MHIAVLGAGIIGITTAWQLAKKGYQVTVIDRQPACALECSFSNGGQLSYSHVEPWATPAVIPKIIHWLGKKDAPLVMHMRPDLRMWRWGMQFLLHCTEEKSHATTELMLKLSAYSKEVLHALVKETHIPFVYNQTGILHIYKDAESLAAGLKQAQFQEKLGCDYKLLTDEECLAKEPSLAGSVDPVVGGIYFPGDETGHAHMFTVNLQAECEKRGVAFRFNTVVTSIDAENEEIKAVHLSDGIIEADAYVVALGAYSPVLLAKIGVALPIYPMKGYSVSIPLKEGTVGPRVSLTDQSQKIVYSRLGDMLRVAGTAEFSGYDHTITEERIQSVLAQVKRLFPDIVPEEGEIEGLVKWACLRPSTPDGRPILGTTPYRNLYLNTGHGTLGWTLANGSAGVVADIVAGEAPAIDASPFHYTRF